MIGKKKFDPSHKIDTVIGSDTIFEGNIESKGTIKVEGKIIGDIKIEGDLYIGEKAEISGNVSASNVHLAGIVEGNIRCTSVLKILASAKLMGDIEVRSFVADEGGLFQGKCKMLDSYTGENISEKSTSFKKSSVINDISEEK